MCVASREASRATRGQPGRVEVARAASTRPPAYWQEVEDGAAAGLGQLQCWARWAVKEVSPGGVSLSLLSLIVSVFYFCCYLF